MNYPAIDSGFETIELEPTLARAATRYASISDRWQEFSSLGPISSATLRAHWYAVIPFLLRGATFSLLQILETFLLIHLHFFFLPPGSLHTLAILSVLHTAFLSAAISIKRAAPNLFDAGESIPHVIRDLARRFVALFAVCAVLLGVAVVALTSLHLSSPPIYRAMIMSWIAGLPLEAGVMIGLYSLGRRRAVLFGRKLTFCQLFQALGGLIAIVLNLPALYIFVHFLALGAAFIYVSGVEDFTQPVRDSAEKRESRRIFPGIVVSSFIPAFVEFSGKVIYLPLAVLSPSFAIALLIAQRLSHIGSAAALRTTDIVFRGFSRSVLIGGSESSHRALFRLSIYLFSGALLVVVIALPFAVARYFTPILGSVYGEPLSVSAGWALLFGLLCLGRAQAGALLRLRSEVRSTALDNSLMSTADSRAHVLSDPSFWLSTFSLLGGLLSTPLVLLLSERFAASTIVWLVIAFDALLLAGLAVGFVICRFRTLADTWTRRGLPALLALRPRLITLLECDAGLKPALVNTVKSLLEENPNVHVLRWSGRRCIVGSSDSIDLSSGVGVFLQAYPLKLGPGDTDLGCVTSSWKMLFTSGYLGGAANNVPLRLPETVSKSIKNARGSVTAMSQALSLIGGVSHVPISELFQLSAAQRRLDVLRYLDLLISRGPVTVMRCLDRSLKGIIHLNQNGSPYSVVLVNVDQRYLMPELSYAAFVHNIIDAGQAPAVVFEVDDGSGSGPRCSDSGHSRCRAIFVRD